MEREHKDCSDQCRLYKNVDYLTPIVFYFFCNSTVSNYLEFTRDTWISSWIRILLAAASQNVIPDTAEAFQDFLDDLMLVGIIPTNEFKRTRMYPKRSSDPDDKLDTVYR